MWPTLLNSIQQGDIKSLSRAISLVENNVRGYEQLLQMLPNNNQTNIIGFTGPPGAGKSSIVDAIVEEFIDKGNKVAVLCIDPSSPFNFGALLGDRIRMKSWYTHPDVFIRSLATRGSLGGLTPNVIEITDLIKASKFNVIIVETVGVGQSEVEISGLADTTVVVLVPEAGDEIQTMKTGLMEIADIFVVNKSDRPGADVFVKDLRAMMHPSGKKVADSVAIVQTVATDKIGITELVKKIEEHQSNQIYNDRKSWLLAEKAYQLIQNKRMNGIRKDELKEAIDHETSENSFNLYRFIQGF